MADCPCPPEEPKVVRPVLPSIPLKAALPPMHLKSDLPAPTTPRSPVMPSCPPVNIRLLTCDDEVSICAGQADAAVTRVNAATTTTSLLAANPLRKTAILWNDSTAVVLIKFGPAASTTSFTWKIGPQSGYELPLPVYIGQITAVWESANGAMQITEEV